MIREKDGGEGTHDHANDGVLHDGDPTEQPGQQAPPALPPLLPAAEEHDVDDDHDEVQREGEVGGEAGGAPHAAEDGLVALALGLGGVRAAGRVAEVGAGAVEADVLGQAVVAGSRDGVGYPVGDKDGGDGHDRCWEGVLVGGSSRRWGGWFTRDGDDHEGRVDYYSRHSGGGRKAR